MLWLCVTTCFLSSKLFAGRLRGPDGHIRVCSLAGVWKSAVSLGMHKAVGKYVLSSGCAGYSGPWRVGPFSGFLVGMGRVT